MTCPALTAGSMLPPPWRYRSASIAAAPHPLAPATIAATSTSKRLLTRGMIPHPRRTCRPLPPSIVDPHPEVESGDVELRPVQPVHPQPDDHPALCGSRRRCFTLMRSAVVNSRTIRAFGSQVYSMVVR